MTERQRDRVSEVTSLIFRYMDCGYTVRDDNDYVVVGIRKGTKLNQDSWNYLYYNDNWSLISRPISYCDNKEDIPCKRFMALKCGKKQVIIK